MKKCYIETRRTGINTLLIVLGGGSFTGGKICSKNLCNGVFSSKPTVDVRIILKRTLDCRSLKLDL
jgi:hypothetical protein